MKKIMIFHIEGFYELNSSGKLFINWEVFKLKIIEKSWFKIVSDVEIKFKNYFYVKFNVFLIKFYSPFDKKTGKIAHPKSYKKGKKAKSTLVIHILFMRITITSIPLHLITASWKLNDDFISHSHPEKINRHSMTATNSCDCESGWQISLSVT